MHNLLSIEDLGSQGIAKVIALSDVFVEVNRRAIPKVPALRGKTVALAFFEDSTRTRISFETAARRLSADTLALGKTGSSLSKGESIKDTVAALESIGADCVVMRHSCAGVPEQVARWTNISVVNAGDGWHEHPTQALVDCYTLVGMRRLGWPEKEVVLDPRSMESQSLQDDRTTYSTWVSYASDELPLQGIKIGIVGDIKHSRVARSDSIAFSLLGARVVLISTPPLLPTSLSFWPVEVAYDLDSVIGDLDVLYLLRIQTERGGGQVIPTLREYSLLYGLNASRKDMLPRHAVIMHPGPVNRGVEISYDIADSPSSLVSKQVANGVPVRMAVLYMLLAGSGGLQLDLGDSMADAVPTHERESGETYISDDVDKYSSGWLDPTEVKRTEK